VSDSYVMGRASSAPGKAIVCMLLGAAVLTANDAVLKWMTGGYSVGQIMFCRGIFIGLPLAFLIWKAGGLASIRPVNPKSHFLRAALVVLGTFLLAQFAIRRHCGRIPLDTLWESERWITSAFGTGSRVSMS